MRETLFHCWVCKRDIFLHNPVNKDGRVDWIMNSPMLENMDWKRVCRYYKLPSSSFICEDCMTKALDSLDDCRLKKCPLTEDWKETKTKQWLLSLANAKINID